MNFLRHTSRAIARFRSMVPDQYWLDRIVEQYRRQWKEELVISGQVLAILRDVNMERQISIPGLNIVTNDGDLYYAQSAAAESPTDDFDGVNSGLRLGSSATAPTKADTDVTTFLATSAHALDATYEKTNDGDTDNTGAAVDTVTWRFSYLTSEGNVSGIQEGAVVDNRTTPTAALTHFLFGASFSKTSSDTLKVFVNHNMLGV